MWGDRWALRSLPLAAAAGITGRALMVCGIAPCCISNNEQWQALRHHNKSQATLETLNTMPGSMLSPLCRVTADEQAVWLGADNLHHSFTQMQQCYRMQSTPVRYFYTWLGGTHVSQEYWDLPGCSTGNERFLLLFQNKKDIYIYIYNECNVDSRDVEGCGLGFVERCSRRQMLKREKSGTGVSIE